MRIDGFFEKRLLGYLAGLVSAQDELDYTAHDNRYHGGHYDPETMFCGKRERGDRADAEVAVPEEKSEGADGGWGDPNRRIKIVGGGVPVWEYVKGTKVSDHKSALEKMAYANIEAQQNYMVDPENGNHCLMIDGVRIRISKAGLFHSADRRLQYNGNAIVKIGDVLNNSFPVPYADGECSYRIAETDFGRTEFVLVTLKNIKGNREIVDLKRVYAVNVKARNAAQSTTSTSIPRPTEDSIAHLKDAWQQLFKPGIDAHKRANLDSEYLDAVKRGDVETAARMVREAAARAMPDTKETRELNVYGGGSAQSAWVALWEVPSLPDEAKKEIAKRFSEIHQSPYGDSFYDSGDVDWEHKPDGSLRLANHWNFTSGYDGAVHCKTDKPVEDVKKWALARWSEADKTYHVLKTWDALGKYQLPWQTSRGQHAEMRNDEYNVTRKGIAQANAMSREKSWEAYDKGGYKDSTEFWKAQASGETGDLSQHFFFDSSTGVVKSADPVTYDDDGNVIPLSKRFDPANPDIRW